MISPNIYSYVKSEEASFQTNKIRVGDNWEWNFRDHVQLLFHLKNGMFYTGSNEWSTQMRAFKNIMEPILNLAYWSEDIEVKDIIFFIEGKGGRLLSFLVKKYHDEVFIRKYNLDTFFDELTESDVDYGGVLIQKTDTPKPEVFQFQTIAFCDQTDILGGPIAFKHYFSPDKFKSMASLGWGDKKNGASITIDDLISLAREEKQPQGMQVTMPNKTPGKNIEIYVLKGSLPEHYLKDNNDMETYCDQVHVIAYYADKKNVSQGVTLYRKEDSEETIKFHTSKKVHGRALGRGVGETMLHPQIWTNFLITHKTLMLQASSKIPLYTDDPTYTNKNRIQDMENLEVTTIEDGKRIFQVPTAAPANVQLFEAAIQEWFAHAQFAGSAPNALLGKSATAGTSFRAQNQAVQLGRGIHDRRRGQRAKFIEEIMNTTTKIGRAHV